MDESPKGRILRAAAHLFVTKGFDKTTVRELAAAVGIQSGSLFHHFKDKEEILASVMTEVIEFNTDRMVQALHDTGEPCERLRALVYCELLSMNGDTSEAMSLLQRGWASLGADNQARILVMRDHYEQMFIDAIEADAERLLPMDPFLLRRLLVGMTRETRNWFRPGGPLSLDAICDHIIGVLSRRTEDMTWSP